MRFRRRLGKRAKRKTTWMSGIKSACPEVLRVLNCAEYDEDPSAAVPADVFSILLVPPDEDPGISRGVSDVTSYRLVGDLNFHWWMRTLGTQGALEAVTALHFHMGIYKDEADINTGDPQQPQLDPGTSGDQGSSDWLWRHQRSAVRHLVRGTTDTAGEELAAGNEHIPLDITVRRKLTKGEGLWFTVRSLWSPLLNTGADFTDAQFAGFLSGDVRALAALP